MNLLSEFPNITVYDKPTLVNFDDKRVLFNGWGYNPLEQEDADVLFTHIEINTFKMSRVETCKDRYKLSELNKKFPLIYSGHFHLRQEKHYPDSSIKYIGNPFQMDFGDEGDVKGIEIIDFKTLQTEFIENDISPKFYRIYISKINQLESVKNKFCRLIIDTQVDKDIINEVATKLTSLGALSVECEATESDFNRLSGNKKVELKVFEIDDAMREYIKLLDGVENKKEIEDYLIGLYHTFK